MTSSGHSYITVRRRAHQLHHMVKSSNGNIFRATGLCVGNSPVVGEFPSQRPVTRSLGVFFGLRLNKRLSKQSWGWWFETLSLPLWRHYNDVSGKTSYHQIWWNLEAAIHWVLKWLKFELGRRRRPSNSELPNNINVLISPWTKWPSFCRRYFHMHFREWKVWYFD